MSSRVVVTLLGFVTVLFGLCEAHSNLSEEHRVIIGAPQQVIHPHPNVKPTAASYEHQPGVPPEVAHLQTTSRPQAEKPDNPFGWLVDWFNGIKGSRMPENSDPELAELYLQDLDRNQTELLYELVNNTKYNTTNEFQEIIQPNKGFFDWLLEITGLRPGNGFGTSGDKPKLCPSCSCGQSFKQIRIVGGVETQVNAYPWMAYLKYNGRFYCGASVINNKYLLTAAHCVSGFNKDRLEITLLDHDRSTPFETLTLTARVANVFKHSRYNQGANYNNDIALIKVVDELDFSGLLTPVCLPTAKRSFTGYTGVVTGWGATQEHGVISNKLREVEVPILANANCVKTGYGKRITENMICAGFDEGQKDSCQGDSGGPLHIKNGTTHQIVGIVSWGEGCAEANFPGVYTRVNRYLTWINVNTKDACYCS